MSENNKAVVECYRENRVSSKKGTAYQVLVLCFENGYRADFFLSNEQQYILTNVVPLAN